MKEALESHGGARGCRVVVAEVNAPKAALTEKWKGISSVFELLWLYKKAYIVFVASASERGSSQ